MKTLGRQRWRLCSALPLRASLRQPDLSGFSAGFQRVLSGCTAGAQGLCHGALEWDFVVMRIATWPQRCSRPGRPAPARELRRCSEGGRKALGRRKRRTEGGRKVLWSASEISRVQRLGAELLQSGPRRRPEGGWKALGRCRRRSEGGRLRPFD